MLLSMYSHASLVRALEELGGVLTDRGLTFRIAVVGGAALLLSRESDRATQDVDVVSVARGEAPLATESSLPPELRNAAEDVADLHGLNKDWLNAGAVGVLRGRLPSGYEQRLRARSYGNLVVGVLGRSDLLGLKVLAASDEGPDSRHTHDVRAMKPTGEELEAAFTWARAQKPAESPEFEDIAQVLGLDGSDGDISAES
jgi:hypothetical protein